MKAQNSSKRENKRGAAAIALIAAVLAVAVIIIASLLLNQLASYKDESEYKDRRAHLMETSNKISTIVDTTKDSVWPLVNAAEHELLSRNLLTEAEVVDEIKAVSSAGYEGAAGILLVDGTSRYIASDGAKGLFTDVDVLLDASEGKTSTIDYIPHLGQNSLYMLFVKPVDIKLPVLDGNVRYIIMAVNAGQLAEKMLVAHENDGSKTVIVRQDGRRIFDTSSEGGILTGYNVFTELSKLEFTNGKTAEEFLESARADVEDAAEFISGGKRYCIGCGGYMQDQWVVLTVVPSDSLNTGLDEYMSTIIEYVTAVFAVIIVLLVAVALLFYRNQRETAAREKEELANNALKQLAEAEKQANIAKSEFLSNMSHDIRTPINGITGMTRIALKSQDDPQKVADCLKKIDESSDHLLSLINDVLDMSRIESGKTEIAENPFDMRRLISDCDSIIRGQLENRMLQFNVTGTDFENPYLLGDELKIRQILINILGNAVKFTPDGGRVDLRVSEKKLNEKTAQYTFEIEDTGIGMNKEFLPKIFDSFTQAESSGRTNYKGTGLGMAITKELSELMGGSVEVESELGKGSKFTVKLPLPIDENPPKPEKADEISGSIRGKRILLVEDNELNLEIAVEILESEGAEVYQAVNGQIAVDLFSRNPEGTYDLILMDVMMPVMDGLTAARTIRALNRPDAATIPIIAMTANAFEEDRQKALDAGMNAHVSKPINVGLLIGTINKITNK